MWPGVSLSRQLEMPTQSRTGPKAGGGPSNACVSVPAIRNPLAKRVLLLIRNLQIEIHFMIYHDPMRYRNELKFIRTVSAGHLLEMNRPCQSVTVYKRFSCAPASRRYRSSRFGRSDQAGRKEHGGRSACLSRSFDKCGQQMLAKECSTIKRFYL